MIKSKLRTAERKRATMALRAPQLLPLVGDGPAAQDVLARLPLNGYGRRAPDSYLGRTKRGGWASIPLPRPSREDLVDARYRDWLADRDRQQVAA